MAQSSIFWPTNGVGDGASQYTDAQLQAWLRRTFLRDLTTEGIESGFANELAVSGASSPVSIATGAALVYGIPYENTAVVSQAIATPSVGTTGHRIVLRASWAAQTVRVTDIASADGTAAIPALVQTPGTTYDIPLATLTITTGGVITVTDARVFRGTKTKTLFVAPRGGYNVTSSIALIDNTGAGITMPDNALSAVGGTTQRPSDFQSLTSIQGIYTPGATGNAYLRQIGQHGALGADISLISETVGYTAVASTLNLLAAGPSNTFASPKWLANEFANLFFWRDSTNVLDTLSGNIYFLGWLITYLSHL